MEVVILAGGGGRRFGGPKQFVPVAPDGATLLEVTLRDARRAGCVRAVIVTAPGREDDVRSLFAARPIAGLEVVVVTQRRDDLPTAPPVARDRPWGTAQALWAARDLVDGPFLVFNADDHYGPNAPATLIAAVGDGDRFAMLGYPLGETLSAAGTVSRAVCEVSAEGLLTGLREVPAVDAEGRVVGGGDAGRRLPLATLVSMNAWAFTPDVFPLLEAHLRRFLATADLVRDECFLPAAVDVGVRAGRVEVLVVPAPDPWCGMTWPEDRARVARRLADLAALDAATAAFGLDPSSAAPVPHGEGLVNATWRVDTAAGPRLLQRLNADTFPDPVGVADNAAAAAVRIDDALRRRGDEDPRHRLVFLAGPEGRPWWRDPVGGVWRCMVFVPGARPARAGVAAEVREAARALGRFPGLVAEGSGPEVTITLPGFHDTPARLAALVSAAAADAAGRLASCDAEYGRLVELGELAERLASMHLPVRPVHNDAKLDNVLVDVDSGEALCVVDLDTTMPGLVAHDFGDLVRSAVTGRPEDEPDLTRVVLREAAFGDLAAGYLEGARGWLTDAERERLVDGALVITYEQAVRFLADHLAGDVYYRVDAADHNLRRARAQLRLLEQLLAAEDDLRRLVGAL